MDETNTPVPDNNEQGRIHEVIPVAGLYENWFLEYASYVILERAVPAIEDGLKPVQRRILHAMKEMDDGRYNKVANIIGSTMQYHPHGDASIGDAIVGLGQKELLIDMQGNWGDVRTGDGAAAPRYIEARLSKFALDVVFNPDTTEWQMSYDGRKREPVTLPVKFPLLLAQGVEGIAVGLATKVLPHNFCELIRASVDVLRGRKFQLFPDFQTGGYIDVNAYNDGERGGKVRVRAKIEEVDKKTLIIREIPYTTTTNSLIESIIKANDAGKIKIKKVVDNTAKDLEILIDLAPGASTDITIDALYAFTQCEVSISPNACVIVDNKPRFLTVSEILTLCTEKTKHLLKRELEIKRAELLEKLLFSSLEQIFITEEMYIEFKEYSDKKTLFEYLNRRFEKHKPKFYREIGDEDYERLTRIPMIRITRFDSAKADELMRDLDGQLKETEHNLAHLTDYAVNYYENLLKKYGKDRERKTEIRSFESINAAVVAANNQKLYVNRSEGFIGYGLKKDEFICDCSDLDDIIVFRRDGKFSVVKIAEKVFVGKDIVWCGVWKKGDERTTYHLVYLDAKSGRSMVKRFQVTGITRDKEYDLTGGEKGSKVLYFNVYPNGESEVIRVLLTNACAAKIKKFDFDLGTLAIKGRASQGNILTKYPIKKIEFVSAGGSTLGGMDVWYNDNTGRLGNDGYGRHLGKFEENDLIIAFYKNGNYELTNYELTNRYDPALLLTIEKYNPAAVISAAYFDGTQKTYYVKRFKIETLTVGKPFMFIPEHSGSALLYVSTEDEPEVNLKITGAKQPTLLRLHEVVEPKGWKALGAKLPFTSVAEWIPVIKQKPAEEEPTSMQEEESEEDGKKKFSPGDSVDLDVKPPKEGDQPTLF